MDWLWPRKQQYLPHPFIRNIAQGMWGQKNKIKEELSSAIKWDFARGLFQISNTMTKCDSLYNSLWLTTTSTRSKLLYIEQISVFYNCFFFLIYLLFSPLSIHVFELYPHTYLPLQQFTNILQKPLFLK